MPLDSDVPNADSQLHVEFYEYDKDSDKGKPYVRIVVPGDKLNVIDTPARDDHKRRFPRQWMYFQMKNTDAALIGTPLSLWHKERPQELSEGQLTELTIVKFATVEQLATASDAQLMRLGMGGLGMRERARLYLSGKNAQNAGAEMEQMRAELNALKAQLANSGDPPKPKSKRGGYRRKSKVPVNVQHNHAPASPAGGQ